jgi:hypothetical protein
MWVINLSLSPLIQFYQKQLEITNYFTTSRHAQLIPKVKCPSPLESPRTNTRRLLVSDKCEHLESIYSAELPVLLVYALRELSNWTHRLFMTSGSALGPFFPIHFHTTTAERERLIIHIVQSIMHLFRMFSWHPDIQTERSLFSHIASHATLNALSLRGVTAKGPEIVHCSIVAVFTK